MFFGVRLCVEFEGRWIEVEKTASLFVARTYLYTVSFCLPKKKPSCWGKMLCLPSLFATHKAQRGCE